MNKVEKAKLKAKKGWQELTSLEKGGTKIKSKIC